MSPAGLHGIVNDALAIHFVNSVAATAFVNRWCLGFRLLPPEQRA